MNAIIKTERHALELVDLRAERERMSSGSSPGESYEKAIGLLQQLQNTIETQQKDISRLQSRVKSLRGQNDELRRERDELRESLADKMNKIAELSRKTSSMKGRVSLPSLQNR